MIALYFSLVVYLLALSATCGFALVRGGPEVRHVATAMLIAVAATVLASAFGQHWHGPNWGVIAVDVAFLAILVAIALRSTRYWPIWAAASQLAGCLAHLPAIFTQLPMKIYVTTQSLWAFPLLLSLAVGAWHDHRARVRDRGLAN